MKFRYFLVFMVVFMLLVGIYIHIFASGEYTHTVPYFGWSVTLPISIYFVLTIFVCFVLSGIFFMSERISIILKTFYEERDFKNVINQIEEQMSGNEASDRTFKIKHYGSISKILSRFNLKPNLESKPSGNGNIDKDFELFAQIKEGKDIDTAKYHISKSSDFYDMAIKNRVDSGIKKSLEILEGDYSDEIKNRAFLKVLKESENEKEIKKAKGLIGPLEKDIAIELLKSTLNREIGLSMSDVSKICKESKFDKRDYLEFAKISKEFMKPDSWMKLFENLADEDESAEKSYFYVLLELEMIEVAKERKASHPKNEFLEVGAYIDLKSINKSYPTEIFFGT